MKRANEESAPVWKRACALEDILPDTGVCCLVGAEQVAVFRVGESSELYAIGNFDPFSRANVLSRGIVGDRGGTVKVASPIYKQNFALATGECLDDPSVSLPTFAVRVRDGIVEVCEQVTPKLPAGNTEVLEAARTA
jgi:nitrite reductase (NADH) small subunit